MRLRGKVAIVTGGAQGLGEAFATRLIEEGAKVVLADILDARRVQKKIEAQGGEALALCTDVADQESVEEMVKNTVERFGRIDILVNNAAVCAGLGTKAFFDIPLEEWHAVMRVNLKGTFLCCKSVYPHMKKQAKGKIINLASGTVFKGNPYALHYVTSKGGIVARTRALARELGDYGICVNAIAPGYTLSEGLMENPMMDDTAYQAMLQSRCFKRDALPNDLTGTVVFLASSDSDFISGQTIVVDGGCVMH